MESDMNMNLHVPSLPVTTLNRKSWRRPQKEGSRSVTTTRQFDKFTEVHWRTTETTGEGDRGWYRTRGEGNWGRGREGYVSWTVVETYWKGWCKSMINELVRYPVLLQWADPHICLSCSTCLSGVRLRNFCPWGNNRDFWDSEWWVPLRYNLG